LTKCGKVTFTERQRRKFSPPLPFLATIDQKPENQAKRKGLIMTCLKPINFKRRILLLAIVSISARAGVFNSDFNSGLPAATAVYGNAVVEGTGGVGDSGALKLTKAVNSQQGAFVIEDLDAGSPIFGFDISFKLLIGGGTGTPADGMSVCFGPDLPNGTWGEEGAGAGLRFSFDIYDNGNEVPLAPSIDVAVGGTKLATSKRTIATISTNGYVDVRIRLNPDGSLNFDYRGETLFTNYFLPNYQALVDAALPGRFGLGARTGGLNANQWVDDLQITTFLQSRVGISQEPFSQTGQQGDDVAFDVRIANTNGVTYQWSSNNVPILGANAQTLIITNVQPAMSGSQYHVVATGPNNSVTSSLVTLTVTNLTVPTPPHLAFNFDDGLVPAEATVTGTALVDTTGGISNSGTLKLTMNVNGQAGAFIVTNSAEGGMAVYGFTARFKTLVGGGTVPPADGFAFAFGNDIPDAPTGDYESGLGLGNGLRVTFDIFNNDGIFGLSNPTEPQPAPSIDVRYGSQVLGSVQLPLSFMETGLNDDLTPRFQDTIIQLNNDATISVVYHGAVVFNRLPIPVFGSITGGRFAVAARTGGLNANMWMDNFELTSVTNAGDIRITTQPVSQTILVNHAMTNTVGVNDTTGVSYQWFRNNAPISGATSSSYVLSPVTLLDSGATFKVQLTKASVTVTSSVATLTVCDLTPPVSPNLTFNFDNGLVPAGTALYGAAGGGYITLNGGVGDSGVLHLTDAVNGQQGAFVISNLYSGAQVSAIAAAFDVRVGGGTVPPADGFSFNFAANLTDGVALGEGGNGNGISILFDIFSPPFIAVRYKSATVASTPFAFEELETGPNFITVLLRVDEDGKLYLSYGERVIYNGLQLPNYTFTSAGKFGFYGRTGGLNENQWLDNVLIKATQSSGPLSVTDQPDDATVIAGTTATFTAGLSDPNGATYQWQKQSAGGVFTNIPGATASSYTTPLVTIGDDGARFRVNASGPSGSTTSSHALLTVVAPITISNPSVIYDFNDGLVPADTTLNGAGGGGYVAGDGGVTNSGVLRLTDAINGQGGTFIIPDLNTNASVNAFTAYFAARIGGGTIPPADGFSFVWAPSNDIPAGIVFGEDGTGLGLTISFDIYDNGSEIPPAPSIDARYKGALVGTRQIPYPQLETGANFGDVFIRVSADGKLDLQYNGMVIFNQVVLPGYAALTGGEFALGARTGGLNDTHWFDNIAIATTVGLVPVPISFARVGNDLRLAWAGDGFKLQSTPSLNPVNWTDVPGATSPYQTPMTGSAQFYRLAPRP
jgi:hypothetical protein